MCRGRRLRGRRLLQGRLRQPAGVRGRARRTASGATRSRCRAPRRSTAAATPGELGLVCRGRRLCGRRLLLRRLRHHQAFVVSETNGVWGNAVEVPGTAALNIGGNAERELGLVRRGRRLRGRRLLRRRLRHAPGVRGRARRTASGVPRSRCRARRPSTPAATPTWTRSRVPRPATARPAATTRTAPALPGVRGQRDERQSGVPRSRCRARRPSTAAATPGELGLVCRGRQLRGRRLLHRRLRPPPGVRGQRDERRLGHRDRGAGHGGPQQRRQRRRELGLVRRGGRLRGRRRLQGRLRPRPGVRGQRDERRLGQRGRGAGHGGPQQRWQRRGELGLVCARPATARPAAATRTAPRTTRRSSSTPPALAVVPRVVGKTLSTAKRSLKAAHCSVGKTTRVYSKLKRGRVVAEKPRAGAYLKSGAKVALTVSKGEKKSARPLT